MLAKDPIWQTVSAVTSAVVPDGLKPSLRDMLVWKVGESPFSTHGAVLGATATYLVTIFGVQALMRDREPMSAACPTTGDNFY
jgi:hypothetical protein